MTAVEDVTAAGSEYCTAWQVCLPLAISMFLAGNTGQAPGQLTLKVQGKLFKFLVDGQGRVYDRKLMNAVIAARRQW